MASAFDVVHLDPSYPISEFSINLKDQNAMAVWLTLGDVIRIPIGDSLVGTLLSTEEKKAYLYRVKLESYGKNFERLLGASYLFMLAEKDKDIPVRLHSYFARRHNRYLPDDFHDLTVAEEKTNRGIALASLMKDLGYIMVSGEPFSLVGTKASISKDLIFSLSDDKTGIW